MRHPPPHRAAGRSARLVVRDPARAPQLPGCDVALADYAGSQAACRALTGVDVLFMVSAAQAEDRVDQHRGFIDGAADVGVRHVVYTSFVGAAPDATFTLGRDHWASEEHLRASGMAWTFLRDNLYADFVPLLAGDDGVIRGPAGVGRLSGVAIDDVADVAAVVLGDPAAHEGAAYALTGPDSLTLAESAAVLTEETGRPVRFHDETLAEAYATRAAYGVAQWQLDAWVSTYTAIAAGEMDVVSEDVPRLAGRPATSLRDLLRRGTAVG